MATSPLARGLDVGPATLSWNQVQPGQISETRLIRVTNRSNEPRLYSIKTKPDIDWVFFSTAEVYVPAKQTGTTAVYLKMPPGPKYFGQSWVFYIEVREKPKTGQAIALACYPRVYVTTANK